MKRAGWLVIGTVGGAIGATLFLVIAYLWVASPVRRLESASGLDLPQTVRLVWERNQRDQFLGQGFTLRAFAAPSEVASVWLTDCPSAFISRQLDTSGIWSKLQEQGLEGGSRVCVKKSETTNHEEIVVIASGQIFHMAIDR